ncbi:zinc finger protein 79-like [Condylostylus longicornis]|uniref:zinc finger protein 79-like n=1 Tax=Condylostylus longicornis TaxID=2530218 RepID=UPI00244E099C|nr:zinc finger protein 79-like [Condylostylus longicornis]
MISDKINLDNNNSIANVKSLQNELNELLTDNTLALGNNLRTQTITNNQEIWNNIPANTNEKIVINNGNNKLSDKLHKICRLCLIEDENLRQIFDDSNCIVDMLSLFTSHQITSNDGLPWKICFECLTILTKCVNFRQQIETASTILEHYIKQGFADGMVLEKIDEDYLEKYGIIKSIHYDLENEVGSPLAEPIQELSVSESDVLEDIIQTIDLPTIEEINNTDNEDFYNDDFNDTASSINDTELIRAKKRKRAEFIKDVLAQEILKDEQSENQIIETDFIRSYKCKDCKENFSEKDDLYVHESVHDINSNNKFICRKCQKEFSELKKMKRHIRTHFLNKPFKCKDCDRGFPEMASLTRHVNVAHLGQKKERKFGCSMCDKKYFDSYSLNVHIRTHNGVKPYACTECDRRFTDFRLLNSHRRTHSGEKNYKCQHCDKKFTHQSTLATHIRTHTGEKPYVCIICGASFIQSSNLRLHMRSHSKEKPYSCDVCSKGFISSSALTMHKRCHTKEKPYACPQCDKRFPRSDLTAHMRTHTKEKPYTCEICAKTFTTSSQLKIHFHRHTEKIHKCDLCEKNFSNSIYLKKHMKTHQTCESFYRKNDNVDQNPNSTIAGQEQDNDAELNESLLLVNNLLAAVAENDLTSNAN